MPQNNRVLLAARPRGEPKLDDFRFDVEPVPEPAAGELLLQVVFVSLDPYVRGRMNGGKSYAKTLEIGDVIEGRTVARVLASRNPTFAAGDWVLGRAGWQTHVISTGEGLRKLDLSVAPATAWLGVLGMPGLTAYAGLLTIGKPRPGETLVVAAATGPVGSAVGQIARIHGLRAIGIAGSEEKRRALIDEFGFDVALNHRSTHFASELAEACPKGIDVYFENVGGHVFRAVLPLLNDFARVPVCGLIAHYNATSEPSSAPDLTAELLGRILRQRLTFRGFIVSDFVDQQAAFERDMKRWMAEGRVKYREDIVAGLDACPQALIGLLRGANFGKLIARLCDD
jgi:NADPH-dependent curcumin reductase CurA